MQDQHVIALDRYHRARNVRPATLPLTFLDVIRYGWLRYWQRRAMRKEQRAATAAPLVAAPQPAPSALDEARNMIERS